MSMRQDGLPLVVSSTEKDLRCEILHRVPFSEVESEDWLQQVLERSPEGFPLHLIDERLQSPLTCLGREVATEVGPIDLLYISSNGQLVVVETKLWRNAEARREVVAQIIDYGAQLRRWTQEQLDAQYRKTAGGAQTLWEAVRPERLDESEWEDTVNGNLAHGRMTLIIAGDGIRSAVETLASAVGRHPEFLFRLALLELRVFKRAADGSYLLVPSVLARTAEIERAVVRVEYVESAQPRVTVETPVTDETVRRRHTLSEEALKDELRRQPGGDIAVAVIDKLLQEIRPPLEVHWRSAGFAVRMLEPGNEDETLPLCVVTDRLILYGYVPWLRRRLEQSWSDPDAIRRVLDAYVGIWTKYQARRTPSQQYNVTISALAGREGELVSDLRSIASMIEREAAAARQGS